PTRLEGVIGGLSDLAESLPVVLPVHPRTRQAIAKFGLAGMVSPNVLVIDPVGYLDMVMLESSAALIATDSGGVQKEAYFNGVPCLTLRDETEWVELVHAGANTLVGTNPNSIAEAGRASLRRKVVGTQLYGDGTAGSAVVRELIHRA